MEQSVEVVKEEELRSAGVIGVKYLNGYHLFKRDGVNLVAVQQIGESFHIIPSERPAMSVDCSSKVIPALLEILGNKDYANGASHELAKFLWRDWD